MPDPVTYPERCTIVLNPDGSVRGAQMERLQVYAPDMARYLPAEPVDPAVLATLLPTQAALIEQVALLTSRHQEAVMMCNELAGSCAQLNAELAAARAGAEALTAELATARARIAALEVPPPAAGGP